MRKMFPLIVLLLYVSAVYSDGHSLRYYYTGVSAPGSGLPEFSTVGYVDDREISNYNSDTGREQPKVTWMEKVEPGYWERNTQRSKQTEAVFRHNVRTAMSRFNQSGGLHIVQSMYGCERGDDGSITGYQQYGYDGREFTALDTRTWTYIPTMAHAQITTQRWNSPDVQRGERDKNYLENICIEWLQKYVENGREDLERRGVTVCERGSILCSERCTSVPGSDSQRFWASMQTISTSGFTGAMERTSDYCQNIVWVRCT